LCPNYIEPLIVSVRTLEVIVMFFVHLSATRDSGDYYKRMAASEGGMSAFSTVAVAARKFIDGAKSSLANSLMTLMVKRYAPSSQYRADISPSKTNQS